MAGRWLSRLGCTPAVSKPSPSVPLGFDTDAECRVLHNRRGVARQVAWECFASRSIKLLLQSAHQLGPTPFRTDLLKDPVGRLFLLGLWESGSCLEGLGQRGRHHDGLSPFEPGISSFSSMDTRPGQPLCQPTPSLHLASQRRTTGAGGDLRAFSGAHVHLRMRMVASNDGVSVGGR